MGSVGVRRGAGARGRVRIEKEVVLAEGARAATHARSASSFFCNSSI
jgi:hypothetical protein